MPEKGKRLVHVLDEVCHERIYDGIGVFKRSFVPAPGLGVERIPQHKDERRARRTARGGGGEYIFTV